MSKGAIFEAALDGSSERAKPAPDQSPRRGGAAGRALPEQRRCEDKAQAHPGGVATGRGYTRDPEGGRNSGGDGGRMRPSLPR